MKALKQCAKLAQNLECKIRPLFQNKLHFTSLNQHAFY